MDTQNTAAAYHRIAIVVLTPWEGDMKWYQAVTRGLATEIKHYTCTVHMDCDGPSAAHLAQIRSAHPGMELVSYPRE